MNNTAGSRFGLSSSESSEGSNQPNNNQSNNNQPKKINIGGNYAALFGNSKTESAEKEKTDSFIDIQLLENYHSHPFSLHTGKRMDDMVSSIKEHGILFPVLVQPVKDGKYEILAGHNRVEAAKRAGIDKVPAIIKEGLTEAEAMLIVVESNLMQRSFFDLKESEKATILWHRHQAMKNKNISNEFIQEVSSYLRETDNNEKEYQRSRDKVGQEYDLSGRTIARYLRVYQCKDTLKELLDKAKIGVYVAVELSYLKHENQEIIAQIIENGVNINIDKAKKLRKYPGELTVEIIQSILNPKNTEKENKPKQTKITIKNEIKEKYFIGKKREEIETIIEKAIEDYFRKGEHE